MRYLRIRLAGADTTLHPLVPVLTDRTVLQDAKMLSWAPSFDPPRVTVLLYLEGDTDHVARVAADTALVVEHDLTPVGRDRGYLYLHADPHPTEWRLFELGSLPGLLPLFPVQYHGDGSLTLRLLGPTPRLREAVTAVPPGIETAIEEVGEYDLGRAPVPPPLSPRQHEAVAVAADLGYYQVPRAATRDEVAARLGCAPSTASEHLRKAEARLVQTLFDIDGPT